MTTSSRGLDSLSVVSISAHKILSYCRMPSMLLLAAACVAQQTAQLPDAPVSQLMAQGTDSPARAREAQAPPEQTITVPTGTRLALVLTHPVDSWATPRGDQVFAQTTAPVIVGDQVAIPGGTYVQGKVDKLRRRGTRAEMQMQSISLIFPNNYIAKAGGPSTIESDQWTAWNNPSSRSKAAMILVPMIAVPLGALIGHAADGNHTTYVGGTPFTTPSHTGLVVGTTVGFGIGMGTSFGLMTLSRGFYIDAGSPMTMRLPEAVTLTRAQVDDANQKAATQPPPVPPAPRRPPVQAPLPTTPPTFPSSGPTSCNAGEEWCEGRCMIPGDFINNDSNCGRCGNRCSFNESCTGVSCGCAPGYTSCMGQCVNSVSFIADNNNCGSCGHSCSIGESCMGGTCSKIGR